MNLLVAVMGPYSKSFAADDRFRFSALDRQLQDADSFHGVVVEEDDALSGWVADNSSVQSTTLKSALEMSK